MLAVLQNLGSIRSNQWAADTAAYRAQCAPSSTRWKTRSGEGWAGRSRRHLVKTRSERENTVAHAIVLTFEHVLDEDAALSNLLVDDELFVVRCHEENHGASEGD